MLPFVVRLIAASIQVACAAVLKNDITAVLLYNLQVLVTAIADCVPDAGMPVKPLPELLPVVPKRIHRPASHLWSS
jgi:hypothetical protein